MTAAPLHMAGRRLMLDPLGAVHWPEAGLLAISDLHLEKGSAAARRGQLVPPWDTAMTLDRLTLLFRKYAPTTVVALGDTFHDVHGPSRMDAANAARLRAMAEAARFIWVLGNHDPRPPEGLPGEAHAEWNHGGLVFRHEARPDTRPDTRPNPACAAVVELCGHHHPKASVQTRGGRITRPCFVADAHRVMLPAVGAYTGGLDVRHPAIARLFPQGGRAFLLGKGRLFSFAL